MKIAKWIILGVVLLVFAVLLIIYLNLNGIVHRTIETQASSSLNLRTTLEDVNLALFGGSLSLDNLEIASPEGYQAPEMLTLGGADVDVSFGQLRQDPVRIQSINLEAPKLVIERKGTEFNFQALMSKESAPPPEGEPLHLVIDKLTVSNAQVELLPGIPGLAQSITVNIPTVELANIGTGEGAENGAAVKDVVMQVVTAMAAKAAESDQVPPEVRAILAGDLKQVASKFANEQLEKITQDILEESPEAAEAIEAIRQGEKPGDVVQRGLGDLLRRNTEQDQPATQPAAE